jgi:hypothetical protein
MKNYEFIIAGLPDIEPDFENPSLDFDIMLDQIRAHLDKNDLKKINWLLFGLNDDNLSSHFYFNVKKSKSRFLQQYFRFDLMLRNIQAAYIARRENLNPDNYLIGENEIIESLKKSKSPDFGIAADVEYATKLLQIFEMKDVLEREKALDSLKWEEAKRICTFNLLDLDVILSFILRAHILKRWKALDKKHGEELFRQYVHEMRNSYKKNKE